MGSCLAGGATVDMLIEFYTKFQMRLCFLIAAHKNRGISPKLLGFGKEIRLSHLNGLVIELLGKKFCAIWMVSNIVMLYQYLHCMEPGSV